MHKHLKYLWAGILMLSACESIYIPELDEVEKALVVDARLVAGNPSNQVFLQWSQGFNESGAIVPVVNGIVRLIDDLEQEYLAVQNSPGVYTLSNELNSERQYRLNIYADGEIYTSEFEPVPPVPVLDTIYSEHAEQWIQPGGENNTGNFIKSSGQQLFVDINGNNEKRYYRFYARNIHQFYFPFDTTLYGVTVQEYKYGWKSHFPQGTFNLAGPAEYSSSAEIKKHPVEFFRYDDRALLDTTQRGMGWIYIMHHYGISRSAYNFYKDLNSQLSSDGKIFDPLYVQARNNLQCITDSGKIVLGNFEIASYCEHRFFVRLNAYTGNHLIRPIEVFHEIPLRGVQPFRVPWFWEH